VACGNVPGIEPGSESPVTPFNFIEFQGTGTLKGIKGSKADFGAVSFFARCEDRNEPGSNGAKDGADIDHYFLHVFQGGTTLLLVDEDGDPATVDPVTISGGNLQIHISSCANPPGGGSLLVPSVLRGGLYFIRGDSNTDGTVDMSDPMFSLGYLFMGGPAPACRDAADANHDGDYDLTDPIFVLSSLFLGGSALPAPYPEPDLDRTRDGFRCQ